MKRNQLLCLLLLAVACGNPHLTKVDGLGTKAVPVIGTPTDLEQGPSLLIKDGLDLKTTEPKISGKINIQNLDIEKGWKVEYKLEKGEHFRILGGSCKADIAASESCDLDIEFFSSTPDIHLDNLIVTYYRESNPSKTKEIKVPLRGERTPKATPAGSGNIQIKSSSHKDEQNYGKALIKEAPIAKAIIKNIGDADVKLNLKIEKEGHFTLTSHNCPEELKVQEECQADISFTASEAGLHQDKLVASFITVNGTEEKLTKFPIMGEKYSEVKPPVRGPLIASEVFSNNIDFGLVSVGVTVKKQIEIQNLGSLSYNLKDLQLSHNDVFGYSGGKYPGLAGTCGDIILPGSCIIELTYRPKAPGLDKGEFQLMTVEGDSVKLNLSGKGDEIKRCESFNEYLIIPEKSYPESQVIFPYLKSHASTTAKLVTLYGKEVNGYIKSLDSYVVKDGMVYLTFKLPKMIGEVVNMNFGVNVRKVIQDNFKDTESLCLSSKNVRKCSGQEFSLESWQKLKNPKFWNIFDRPVNTRFEEQFVNNEKKCGSFNCMDLKTQYELADIFELTKDELEVIRKDGTISLIFSDDTRMLSVPRISVKTKVVTDCGH